MSVRLEVLRNGKRVCISGINGDGVLNVIIDYIKHPDSEPRHELHVGGLGHYHPTLKQAQHVWWPAPRQIDIGDEITIRLLPAGDFEPPEGLTPHTSCSIDDPVFGHLDYNIDAWNGTTDFDLAPFKSAHVHLVASDAGPAKSQRKLFKELKKRHPALWPAIAEALIRCHAEIESYDELIERIDPRICINIYDDSGSLELSYSMQGDSERRAYVVTVRNWQVAEICSVE